MNERIKELREQAFDWVQYQLQTVGSDHPAMQNEQLQMVNEKFAELIVRECAGVAEVSMPVNSYPDDRLTVKNNVLKHFGVEE